ncbi:uroporphyrinogen-III C-methyltransferase [Phormidium tenue FACHB-886]|nr:uroporphyrinogen-III C-methyltransferase [Phormidium tenue FACHB-886]
MTHRIGTAYLVGSGVGSLAHLTLRAQQLLGTAEVLIYDALVDAELLQLAPEACLKLNVGKRGGQPSASQAEINELLVTHCQQGQQVVRLKSGDPFVFGRSTAEIQALIAADCPFEVVPGLSSALAAPLLASIPLTDPVLSRSFTVLSAHEPEALDWENLAHLETLVILMGGRTLAEIVDRLLTHGRSPQTPIAIIRWAGHPQQQLWINSLEAIVQHTSRQFLSPCIIVIGEVVNLRPYLQSPAPPMTHPPLPLTGKTLLTTRAAGQASQFSQLLRQQGATVIEMPALEIYPPSSWEKLDEAIAALQTFDWLILTSTNAVNYFFDRLTAQGKDARALAGIQIAVVGQKTAVRLEQRGIQPDFVPPNFVADSLIETFPDRSHLSQLKLLFPRVETGGREVLVKEFMAQGATVVEVAAYESGCAKAMTPEAIDALRQGKIDVITFASSKTVRCFAQLWQTIHPAGTPLPPQIRIASIGPQTSKDCLECFGRVDIEAQAYTLPGLTEAIVQWAIGG